MPIIRLPDERLVRFPDDMPKEKIKGIISRKFPEFEKPKLTPLTEEQKAKPKDNYWQGAVLEGVKGFGQGLLSGLGRMASGASLGATDWIDRKTGGHLANLEKDLQQAAEQEGLGGANQVAKFLPEMSGLTRGASKFILKGAKTLPAMIGKGTIEGGIYGATSSDNIKELPTNIFGGSVVGGAGAGVLGLAGKGIKRFVPALNAEGKAKSLQEAFSDRESTAALKKGAKASQEINDKIANEMPTVKDSINEKMNKVVDSVVGEKPNIDNIVNTAKANYSQYAEANANNPVEIKKIFKDYQKYTPYEKDALEKAIKSANYETNAQVGTVQHTHQMRMAVDDMIDASKSDKAKRLVPSLKKIRDSLDNILKTDEGYKAIDNQYEEAMRIRDAFEMGQNASKKSKIPSFKNEIERKAWLSGANDTLQNNLINTDNNYAKSVLDNLGVLKKALNSQEITNIKNAGNQIRKEYQRAVSLDKIVNKESYANNRPFWREVLESIGSIAGSAVTGVESALYGLSDKATANRILKGVNDSTVARNVNRAINEAAPTISAVFAKKMADYGK